MPISKPCELCGCSEVYLHDGYYFCSECGTQDANFQETCIEAVETEGGGILHGQKKKIRKTVEAQAEMSNAWYKWHCFNFLLKGVADELVEYGVEPSFKTKLMWVWTRYLKYYLQNTDMGFNENPHQCVASADDDSDSDQDEPLLDLLTTYEKVRHRKIKSFSMSLFASIIYIALNLDKSKLTLTHLIQLFKDGILSVPYRIHNIVPKEMKPEKLNLIIRKTLVRFKSDGIRLKAMTLMKRLDLGNPVMPDLRLIIDNHLKELCLPKDLKPLVLSLMQFKPCNFMDVNSKDKVVHKMPAYEFHVMTYIIWALKLCLGLDGEYEVKLSSAVKAINEREGRPRSYFVHGESAPTNRMFSYQEWVTFFQYRLILLRHYCYRYANKCTWDTDVYIALEHHMDILDEEIDKTLRDEMTYDLINRIKGGEVESLVIPKSEFKPTCTPFHTYSLVIAQHLQDPEEKLKLTEDFSQYSLKYAIEDWNLVDPNSEKINNLVIGVRKGNKVITNKIHKVHLNQKKYNTKKMVYVRNCENHNWLTTKPPTMEHLVNVDKLDSGSANQDLNILSENPIDSTVNNALPSSIVFTENNCTESEKFDEADNIPLRDLSKSVASNIQFPDIVSEKSVSESTFSSNVCFLDDTKVFENSKLDEDEKEKLRQLQANVSNPNEITEEAEGINIFDDDFKVFIKEEVEDNCQMNVENTFDNYQDVPIGNNQTLMDNRSYVSSIDSVVSFNEASFDRAAVIKELIIYTCKKHKFPLPPEYNENRKMNVRREMGLFSKREDNVHLPKQIQVDPKLQKIRQGKWKELVDEYNVLMTSDVLAQIGQQVKMAVQNANQQAETTLNGDPAPSMDFDNAFENNNDNVQYETQNEITNATIDNDNDSDVQMKHNSDEEKLFSNESDGETYAKELLPEKNPNFDEEVYDATQLFVKAAKPTDEGEMELDPNLSSIIDKKMQKDTKDPSLLTWTQEKKKPTREDSEDEMPLSVLQELNEFREKLKKQDVDLEPLLEQEVEGVQYWFKFFSFDTKSIQRSFEKHVYNNIPSGFSFLLRQCSLILNEPEGDLYRNLQRFETTMAEKLKLKIPKTDRAYNETKF